jgi:hypothetical protein
MIQMVDNNSFLFIPSDFLLHVYDRKVANKRINIDNYYCNIEDKIGIIFKL